MKEWDKHPTCCKGQEKDGSDACIHFRWKRYSPFDRKAQEALNIIGFEGSRFAPFCKRYNNFHHKLTGNWTSDDYGFLRQVWHMGCPLGIKRGKK